MVIIHPDSTETINERALMVAAGGGGGESLLIRIGDPGTSPLYGQTSFKE